MTRAGSLTLATLLIASGCQRSQETTPATLPAETATQHAAATFVGGEKCSTCHLRESELWRRSHHALAMQTANATTVLGDFNNTRYVKDGIETRFRVRDGRYFVRTDGPDGKLVEFEIMYTFGVEPLQQYLVPFPDGRMQALGVAWDARTKEQGGQRWFSLYPDEKIDHRDVLHWTHPAQNWNHQCAECHSTNLQRNYHADTRRFETTWSDVSVSCEACHGPGSRHIAWAEKGASKEMPDRGLELRLADHSTGQWAFKDGEPIAKRSTPLDVHAEVETCARCHSRRAQLWPDYRYGEMLAQTHRVALLEDGLYFADGQMRDEVYEYGSFLQSRMYATGVTCSDCHEPHSATLRASGNALCSQCHLAAHFDTAQHHHHPAGSAAAQCVSCHMVERTYMVIDGRRDHSFRVPRPDLSASLDTPNACTDCHAKNDAAWAASIVAQWFPNGRQHSPHYGQAIQAGREAGPDAPGLLRLTAEDISQPAIVRATAFSLMAAYPDAQLVGALQKGLRDADALVRRGAAEAAGGVGSSDRIALLAPLLHDPVRTLRIVALGTLLGLPRSELASVDQQALDAAIRETRQINLANADRPESQVNLGSLEARLGNMRAAETAYQTAIGLEPSFVPAYINLADLYRMQGLEDKAEASLRRGIQLQPQVAGLHYALGLTLVRQKRLPDAVRELTRAAQLEPDEARYTYVHAIALNELGDTKGAVSLLADFEQRHPANREVLTALVQFSIQSGDTEGARRWARKLSELSPGDPQVRQLLEQLGGS